MYLQSTSAQTSAQGFWQYAFPREIIFHRSARADFLFWITRKLMTFLLLLPVTISSVATVGYFTHLSLGRLLDLSEHQPAPASPLLIGLFTLSMLLVYDLSYYLYHRMQHRFPILWELHKVHHPAEVLVGVTKDRIHPLDDILNRLWDGVLPGLAYGAWLFFALNPVELTIFGMNVYLLRKILILDYVRHTHLKISFGRWLNNIIICPRYHQLHHSRDPRHYNRNFGFVFTVWDQVFGTLAAPALNEEFSFGLPDDQNEEYQSLSGLYVLPVRKIFDRLSSGSLRPETTTTDIEAGGRIAHLAATARLEYEPDTKAG